MEEDKNLNQSPVQDLSSEQTPSVVPPILKTSKPKFKTPILIVGIIIFLLLIVSASAAFIFLPKSSPNQPKQPEAVITPQPTSLQTTIIPSPTSSSVSSPTPTPDLTANWKTYINTQYGYSIKYPPTVAFKSDRFYLVGDDNRKDTADGFGPNLAIYFRGSDKSPQDAASQELSSFTQTPINVSNATGVKISRPETDYYLVSKIGGKNVLRIAFSSQDYSQTVPKDKIDQMRSIADQMLSTFKFTN